MAILFLASAACGLAASAAEPGVYAVDAAESDIHWRVYKAGAFSRFGHNHVISAGELSGTVSYDGGDGRSSFELIVPVAGLVVDDPTLRARYGEDFSSEPSEDDIAGTRRNMLSETVLDGERHPQLRIRGRLASGELDAATFAVTIEMLGRTIDVTVPGKIVADGDALVATGEFRLTHADLGMEPFSVMMGALAVGEPLDFVYRVRAVKSE
jgi:polyisoprenoid-binding protein YceI